jgi:hypothetical protein
MSNSLGGYMKNFAAAPLVLVCFLLSASNAVAQGTLQLDARTGDTHQFLNIDEANGTYQGSLTTDGVDENVFAYYTTMPQALHIQTGADQYSVDFTRSSTQVTFTGTLSQGRTTLFFGTYKTNRSTWLYDGTIGDYEDLTGKGRADSLDMSYGKYKLSLDSTGSGNCSGVLRIGATTVTTFSCATSGSLLDAFFTNPDQLLMWIVNLYLK